MGKILKLYIRENKNICFIYSLFSFFSIFTDALFVIAINRVLNQNLEMETILIVVVYFVFFILRMYSNALLKPMLEKSLLNWLKSRLVLNMTQSPGMDLSIHPHTLHDIQLNKLSSYTVSLWDSAVRFVSFAILNIAIIVENNWMISALILFIFLTTIVSAVISKNLSKTSRRLNMNQSENYDIQYNLIGNKRIINNLNSKEYLLSRYSDSLNEELSSFDTTQSIKESYWRFEEFSFVMSNVVLPLISLILISLGKSSPVLLPLFISMAPRISNSAKIISNTIISTREVKPIIDMYITFLKKKGKVLDKKRNDRIYMSGTLPFVKKDLLFSIEKNGLYAITGSSGSGKTTVLKLLSGLIDKPENLTINVNPKNSLDFIGINPFYMEDTILENLKIATGKDERTVKRVVNYVTELSGVDFRGRLEEKCENYYSNYSDGQKRLINLCHILLSDSDVLLLDEPTANLDKKTKINLIKVLKELSKNKIIICTTHDQDLINDSEVLSDLERRDMN